MHIIIGKGLVITHQEFMAMKANEEGNYIIPLDDLKREYNPELREDIKKMILSRCKKQEILDFLNVTSYKLKILLKEWFGSSSIPFIFRSLGGKFKKDVVKKKSKPIDIPESNN